MEGYQEASILRIYISSTDKFKYAPLYEVIVFAARRNKLAGATVLRGIMGFGASSRVYSLKFWEIEEKVPLVVEIIDTPEEIARFVKIISPYFDKVNKGVLITTENVSLILTKKGKKG